MRPPTAGIRVLDLGGVEAAKTMEFLRSIHRSISLTGNSLSDNFDVVLASNVGIFFALALFLEKWTLEDCKHHLRRLVRPKQSWIRSWSGTINFGKALKWELRDVRSVNQPALVIHTKRKLLSNVMAQSEADSTSLVELQRQYARRCDCLVQYNGGPISRVLVKQMTNQLISSLFYIELAATPTFYRSPHACELVLRCRLTPGAALFGLLLRLCRDQAYFLYRGDELEYKRIRVCEENDLKACQNWAAFERPLQVRAVSPSCEIDIQIDGDGIDKIQRNTGHNISNCPYRLEHLTSEVDTAPAWPTLRRVTGYGEEQHTATAQRASMHF
ncbi:hypothetical protein VDGE_05154 [Verticillium dahliae]|uniref:Uncharacterized protein n=1 Tax=Verticillium dahliae TaxID=27337 RepID=A0A444RSX8_VERDA|nr:hypothetical protein VDGE_05154 [Verticillium dahliae]